jgi:hypothetical protein|tara:strand:+ start:106 stop:243 length:138 start_codon:yes stop_codon:yes gene_type:complete
VGEGLAVYKRHHVKVAFSDGGIKIYTRDILLSGTASLFTSIYWGV